MGRRGRHRRTGPYGTHLPRPLPRRRKASAEDTSARTATATVPAAFKPRLLKDLEAFHRVAVAPYWSRIASHLEADRNVRGQITLSGGIDQLLGTLHPAIRWDPPVLEVPGEGEDIKLEDSGLLLAPAFFLFSRAPVLIEQRAGLPPLLSYPVPVKQDWSDEPQGAGAGSDQALRARSSAGPGRRCSRR